MGAVHDAAKTENAAFSRKWPVGGSDRYPVAIPKRARPKPAPKRESPSVDLDEMGAFDQALEHVAWCRDQGMSPMDVGQSIGSRNIPHTWGAAIDILERYIVKMTAPKTKPRDLSAPEQKNKVRDR